MLHKKCLVHQLRTASRTWPLPEEMSPPSGGESPSPFLSLLQGFKQLPSGQNPFSEYLLLHQSWPLLLPTFRHTGDSVESSWGQCIQAPSMGL